ncbi:hypothetical protein HYZ99_04490 [Candidatus Peregrinibacteria bacterium]|nr:hypothetical protein [Candidatus Peregrinibacteria bacterium]
MSSPEHSARELALHCFAQAIDLYNDPEIIGFNDAFRAALRERLRELLTHQSMVISVLEATRTLGDEERNRILEKPSGKVGDPTFVKFNLIHQLQMVLNSLCEEASE